MTAAARSQAAEPSVVGGVRLGSYGNCIIHDWSGPARPEEMEALTRYTMRAAEAWPRGLSMLVVIEVDCPMPTGDEKRALEKYFLDSADHLKAVAYVAEGTGLWASMARSVMTAIRLVRRRPYPTKVMSDSAEGIEWLRPFLATSHDGPQDPNACEGLTRYLADLRRA